MKRTFVGLVYNKARWSMYSDELVSEIVNGIISNQGEIISVSLSPAMTRGTGEHLLIFYEDNNRHEEISKFLEPYKRLETSEYKGIVW